MSLGIGFEVLEGSGAQWQAGLIYYSDLFHALRATYGQSFRIYLLDALHGTPIPAELRPFADGIVAYPSLKRLSPEWALNHAQRRLLRGDLKPDRVLRAHGVDVVACGELQRHTTLPTLAFLPDLQHRHLPELFSPADVQRRDAAYFKTAERATRVLLMTETVRVDFVKFFPAYAPKSRVAVPVSHIDESLYAQDPRAILAEYQLPEKFVYLPNQFWLHKNHLTAFRALKILRERGVNVFLVCTGSAGDYRNSAYFSELLQAISRWGIRDQVALLGLVPRAHVFSLIRQSAFLLNPSGFEGYGQSLAESRAVGKRALVSNLPALREQDAPCTTYFDPGNVEDLALRLETLWQTTVPGPDLTLETAARRAQPDRVRAYAETYMQIIREIAPHSSP